MKYQASMHVDLNASALLYILDGDIMEGTHSGLMQRELNGHLQVQTPAKYDKNGKAELASKLLRC